MEFYALFEALEDFFSHMQKATVIFSKEISYLHMNNSGAIPTKTVHPKVQRSKFMTQPKGIIH
jgi:hypothetical protein